MNKNNITTPVKCYLNAKKEKINILKENSDKSGIYEWNNLITGKSYIGSAMNLKKRLKDYFSINSFFFTQLVGFRDDFWANFYNKHPK